MSVNEVSMLTMQLVKTQRSRRRPDAARNGPQPLTIEALRDFDWRATEPRKIRPIKPVYHITMGKKKTASHLQMWMTK